MRLIVSLLIASAFLAFPCPTRYQSSVASSVGDTPRPPVLKKSSLPMPTPPAVDAEKDPASVFTLSFVFWHKLPKKGRLRPAKLECPAFFRNTPGEAQSAA